MSEDLETYTMTLQEERDYYCKCMRELQQENEQLKSILIKLEEYMKAVYNMPEINIFEKMPLDMIIEKLQKLKEKYNENNNI